MRTRLWLRTSFRCGPVFRSRSHFRFVIIFDPPAVFVGGFVDEGWRSDGDAFARWHEPVLVRSVFDDAKFTDVVDVAVFAHHLAGGEFSLDLETSVSTFISVGVGAVVVVPIYLLENRYWCRLRSRLGV